MARPMPSKSPLTSVQPSLGGEKKTGVICTSASSCYHSDFTLILPGQFFAMQRSVVRVIQGNRRLPKSGWIHFDKIKIRTAGYRRVEVSALEPRAKIQHH